MSPSKAEAVAALLAVAAAVLLLWLLAWHGFRTLVRAATALPRTRLVSGSWARAHPARAWLRLRFPRAYAQIGARLAPDRFEGLPLTLLVAAALYLAVLLGGLVEAVLEAEGVAALDDGINALFADYRTTFLTSLALWITDLGAQPALVAVTIVSTGFLWADRRPSYILPLWVAILGSQLTTWAGKFGFDRSRPEFTTAEVALSPSFPSAHATGSMAVYGFVAYAIARDATTPRQRFEITFWVMILISVIGFSRIFLSVHYASDVAAGFLVGLFWLLVGMTLREFMAQKARARGMPEDVPPGQS